MPSAQNGSDMDGQAVLRAVSGSVYLIVAGKTLDDIKQGAAAQAAVAISDSQALTNCHVINGRDTILVKHGDKFGFAVATKTDSDTDRCIIRVIGLPLSPVQGVRKFSSLRVGEKAFSVGAPGGVELTLGEGVVSGLGRLKNAEYVKTSAPIARGSSGGGLFDSRGNLIGITTLFAKDVPNVALAISAEDFWNLSPLP